MTSLLVTNDFPPKIGGIQSYLWELWRRLPPDETTVMTTPYSGDRAWDAEQEFRIVRRREPVLLPTPALARDIDALAREVGADVIFLDPALPLGLIGARLTAAPWVVVVHGAEITVPGRLPSKPLLRRVLRGAAGIVAAGGYPLAEAERAAGRPLPSLVVPPGIDPVRFRPPVDAAERSAARQTLGLDPDARIILGASRLVPRKGFDVMIDALSRLPADVQLVIVGGGRDQARLEQRARSLDLTERVQFLGRVSDEELPLAHRAADLFAMVCRDRWVGLEAEGFGIVFLEAGASGLACVAGRSGGSDEAVLDGETGLVVAPRDPNAVAVAIRELLDDPGRRAAMGAAARRHAEAEWSYDERVGPLARLAAGDFSGLVGGRKGQ
ncbi:MAG: glycosyltransferase family 4 protein [Acidimicrobiia bacterium]|nr:glycosyltransferase family 4 protein [Acidimicrobiia bacterium]